MRFVPNVEVLESRLTPAPVARFHSVASSVDASGALTVAFDQRGLGQENIDYLLTAQATAVYACINRGGHHPEAANKETVNSEVTAAASFEVKNGRVQASITAGPPGPGSFACPRGQDLVLASVNYVDIVLADLTNDETATAEGVGVIFFDV